MHVSADETYTENAKFFGTIWNKFNDTIKSKIMQFDPQANEQSRCVIEQSCSFINQSRTQKFS